MNTTELEALLSPVNPESPCGVDLEGGDKYDPAYLELDRITQVKPEQQIGSTIIPAEEPDWKTVRKKATELLARSKDLRVACHLTNALLRTDGWAGFGLGVAVLRGLVERYWPGLFPALDPDDGDPQVRITSVLSIGDGGTLAMVRTMPLIASRTVGKFSIKDLEIAAGDAPPDRDANREVTGSVPTTASIDGIVMNVDLPLLVDTTAALKECVDMLAGLEAGFAAHVEASRTPNFNKLAALLSKGHAFLAAKLAQRAPSNEAATDAAAQGGEQVSEQASASDRTRASGASFTGGISSRDDVLRAIDGIIAYYVKYEPASPIPMLVGRCKRLVTMDFIDIVRELVPDAMAQIEALQGHPK
jgi:type VI secretion system protein ImpA